MQLEVSLRTNSQGSANLRLFNANTQAPVLNSDVSTNSTIFISLTSKAFSLPAGANSYKIEVTNSTGDNIFIQNARIKVNF